MLINARLWLTVAVLAVILALGLEVVRLSFLRNRLRTQLVRAESSLVASGNALVAAEASKRDMARSLGSFRQEVESLQQQLGQRAKVVEVVRWKTKEVRVETTVPGVVLCPPGYQPITVVTNPPTQKCAPIAGGPAIDPCPECPPVKLSIAGVEARLQSRAGSLFAVGEVTVTQTEPLQSTQVLPWSSGELKIETPPATRVRWMLGGGAQLTDEGMQYGAAVVTPAMRLGKLSSRAVVTATTDFNQHGAVGGFLVLGWARK